MATILPNDKPAAPDRPQRHPAPKRAGGSRTGTGSVLTASTCPALLGLCRHSSEWLRQAHAPTRSVVQTTTDWGGPDARLFSRSSMHESRWPTRFHLLSKYGGTSVA
jgi:hypothetical protein